MIDPHDDIDGTENDRRWNQYLDAVDGDEEAEAPKARDPLPLPIRPESVRHVHRLTLEEQDEWSNRMKARYGGEW
jgi:hypothetical protein